MTSNGTANIICVKWGTKYPADEVNALFSAAKRNLTRDARFFCMTDDPVGLARWIEPLPLVENKLQKIITDEQVRLRRSAGALRKVAVFEPGLIPDLNGPLLCLDIDILITGSLDELFDFAPGKVCMPPPFKARSHIETKGEGSVIRFEPRIHTFLFDEISRNTEEALALSMGSEQRYTSFTSDRHGALENYPASWVISFLRSCRPPKPFNMFLPPKRPHTAKIVCFPSEPKAHEALKGHGRGLRTSRPAHWIAEYL